MSSTSAESTGQLENRREVTDAEVHSVMDRILAGQSFVLPATIGPILAVLGVVLWGTFLNWVGWTEQWIWQTWSCILVVGLVGFFTRVVGKGVEPRFAVLGALLGFVIPVLGEIYANLATKGAAPTTTLHLISSLSLADLIVFTQTRSVWDWILFVIGAMVGSATGRKKVTTDAIRARLSWRPAADIDQVAQSFMKWDTGL